MDHGVTEWSTLDSLGDISPVRKLPHRSEVTPPEVYLMPRYVAALDEFTRPSPVLLLQATNS